MFGSCSWKLGWSPVGSGLYYRVKAELFAVL
jgi:hypothetical protein